MITNGMFPVSESTGLPGFETVAEERKLIELAKLVPENGTIVEIGGELGRSAGQFLLATNGKGVKVYTVDLFPLDHHVAGNLLIAQKKNLIEAIGVEAVTNRHIQVKGVSWEVGTQWDKGLIDLLFIDGDHTYEGVSKDIAAWLKHVKPGGIVAFHDYAVDETSHYLHHEVKKAVDEWYANYPYERQGQVDSLIWFNVPHVNIEDYKTVLGTNAISGKEFKRLVQGEWLAPTDNQELTYEPLEDDKPVVKSEPKPKGKPGRKPKGKQDGN